MAGWPLISSSTRHLWTFHYPTAVPQPLLARACRDLPCTDAVWYLGKDSGKPLCRFLETLLCEAPSSPESSPKTAAGSVAKILISVSSTLTAALWLHFILSQFGKHPQRENWGNLKLIFWFLFPQGTQSCVCGPMPRNSCFQYFASFYHSLWQKNKSLIAQYPNQNQSFECPSHTVSSDGL